MKSTKTRERQCIRNSYAAKRVVEKARDRLGDLPNPRTKRGEVVKMLDEESEC